MKLFGTNHSVVGSSYINIGNIYSEQVKIDKAWICMKRYFYELIRKESL